MAAEDTPDPSGERQRIDKWLWYARFVRSRALAAELAGSGRLRINGTHCTKPAQHVRPGDVLTFPQGGRIRIIRIEAIGTRRGRATEAAELYSDLDSPSEPLTEAGTPPVSEELTRADGRPTKRDRREIDKLRRNGP